MNWYIRMGDEIPRNHVIKFPFYREIKGNYKPRNLVFKSTLWESDHLYVLLSVSWPTVSDPN